MESDDESSDDEDQESLPAVRSYAALMQSFTSESGPQAKRRKLDQAPDSKSAKATEEDDLDLVPDDVDDVEEPEEGPETATDGLLEEYEEVLEDSSDPFEVHFADPDNNVLSERLKSLEQNQWASQKTSILKFGKMLISIPQKEDPKTNPSASGPDELKLKQKLASVMSKKRPEFDDLEKNIAPSIFGYQDVLYCERSPTNSETLRRLACLHAVNHVFKLVLTPCKLNSTNSSLGLEIVSLRIMPVLQKRNTTMTLN